MQNYIILHKPQTVVEAVTVMDDPTMSLYAWQLRIQELITKHGPNATLSATGRLIIMPTESA